VNLHLNGALLNKVIVGILMSIIVLNVGCGAIQNHFARLANDGESFNPIIWNLVRTGQLCFNRPWMWVAERWLPIKWYESIIGAIIALSSMLIYWYVVSIVIYHFSYRITRSIKSSV
jgi:hypothetical protein